MVEKQYDLFQISLEYDLNLFFRIEWFHQNIPDSCAFRTIYISKELISYKTVLLLSVPRSSIALI